MNQGSVPKDTRGPCVLSTGKKCYFISLWFWWSQTIITFIKSQPLSTCLSVFCMRMREDGIMCSGSLVFSRKDACTNHWVDIWSELFFFLDYHLYLKEQMKNYRHSDVSNWQMVSKIKWMCYRKAQLIVFVANGNNRAFKWKLELWKTQMFPLTCQLPSPYRFFWWDLW